MSPAVVKRAARHSTAAQNELHCAMKLERMRGGEKISPASSSLQSSIFYNSPSINRLQYIYGQSKRKREIAMKIEKLELLNFMALIKTHYLFNH